jgi:hypothetical protein
MRELLENTAQRAISYLEGLDTRSVAPAPEAVAKLATLNEALSEDATPPEQVVKLLDEVCSGATMAMASPRFFGFVIGGSLPAALAANWLAGAWDQNTGLYNSTPATAQIEPFQSAPGLWRRLCHRSDDGKLFCVGRGPSFGARASRLEC